MKEIWKDIVGYEGLYQVSSLGRIKSKDRKVYQKNRWNDDIIKFVYKGKIINTKTKGNNYVQVHLTKNKKQKRYLVHRLVAEAFIPNTQGKSQVNHINCIKYDNRVENLEWNTPRENTQHAIRNNRKKQNTIKINQYDLNGKFIKQWESMLEIAKKFNTTKQNIWLCCNQKHNRKQAIGYIWRYAVEDNM